MSAPTVQDQVGLSAEPVDDAATAGGESPESTPSSGPTDASAEQDRPVPVALASLAAGLATAAAGFMTAGMFEGVLPRFVGLLGALIGAGIVGVSYRTKSPSILQYLALPILMVVGAILVIPDATGGTANLPGLVAEAVRDGGLSQPPVPFAPGWRFILVVLVGVLGSGSAALSISLNRPKLGILLPVPFIFATALAQPADATVLSSIVALALAIGAMSVAFGADLAKEGATSGNFEARRLLRGGAVLLAVAIALAGLSQLGFLFPDVEDDQIIEPQRPEIPPPAPDRELFTAELPITIPMRLGVLDVYGLEEQAWLTPPFRRSRLAEVGGDGVVPLLGNDGGESATILEPPLGEDAETMEVTFTISDVPGRIVPNVQNPLEVHIQGPTGIEYDPRTQAFQVTDSRARSGTTYTVVMPTPPDTRQLVAAPPAPERMLEFLVAPEPPVAIEELLAAAPTTNLFDRLQFVRNAFYTSVIASGAGDPVDVPPSRVVEMLEGGKGTPYEITAAEVLLARWAGVPSRIGYGYYGGDEVEGQPHTLSIRPVHGAMWLEAYFEGHGWVPIVGTPPQAQASLSEDEQREDPSISATDELALLVYVPIKLDTIQLLFEVVRFWLYRLAPAALGAGLLLAFYPAGIKAARRARRRRWARRIGPAERIAVAYAELRDLANDYNFGDPQHTPLEFLHDLAPDAEHRELAWLVSRAMWGDLSRDLRPQDAESGEELATSIAKRLRRANNGLPWMIALASRASLKQPWTTEVPNLWPSWTFAQKMAALRRRLAPLSPLRLLRRLRGRRLLRRVRTGVATLMMGLLFGGCAQTIDLATVGSTGFPETIVPTELGDIRFQRETSVEDAFGRENSLVEVGQVFSIHEGAVVQGSLQVGAFKPGLAEFEREVRDGVVQSIGGGRFRLTRLGGERVFVLEQSEQRLFMWFPAEGSYYELLVARKEFDDADELFLDILAYQKGQGPVDPDDLVEAPDIRRDVNA